MPPADLCHNTGKPCPGGDGCCMAPVPCIAAGPAEQPRAGYTSLADTMAERERLAMLRDRQAVEDERARQAAAVPTFRDMPARSLVINSATLLRGVLAPSKRRAHREAWATLETFLSVAMRVLDNTPAEVIKGSAVTEEIKARLDGRPVA